MAVPVLKNSQTEIQKAITEVVNFYPDQLEIKITKGLITTNQVEPYFLSLPADSTVFENPRSPVNILVIDTKTPFSSTQFNEYQTVAWLTKDTIFYKSGNRSEIKAFDLTKIGDFTVNKNLINSLEKTILPWLKYTGPILAFLIFTGVYLSYDFRLLYLFFLAFLIWLLTKVFKKTLSYGQSYKMGLYAITLGLIIETILSLTSQWISFPNLPFMFTIISLAIIVVNYLLAERK